MAAKLFTSSARTRAARKQHGVVRGFTLVELLVAIGVLAVVAVLGWRGLDSIVRARVSLTNELEQARGLQLAFAQMQRDCAQIVTLSTIPDRAPLVVEPNRIVLVRMVFVDNQPSRAQVVAYHLKEGVLSRRESRATRDLNELDSLWAEVTTDNVKAPNVVLQNGVDSMAVRVWIQDGAGWRTPGVDIINSTSTANAAPMMPNGMEVSLQLKGNAGKMTKLFLLGAV